MDPGVVLSTLLHLHASPFRHQSCPRRFLFDIDVSSSPMQ
jgi:hypothetical protein